MTTRSDLVDPPKRLLDVSEIIALNVIDTGISLDRAYIKLGEEFGELGSALLKHQGSPNASRRAEDNVLEEVADVIVCALDIMTKAGHTVEDLQAMLVPKCDKRRRKIEAYT